MSSQLLKSVSCIQYNSRKAAYLSECLKAKQVKKNATMVHKLL